MQNENYPFFTYSNNNVKLSKNGSRFAEFAQSEDREPEKSPWQTQIQWEETHLGNFR